MDKIEVKHKTAQKLNEEYDLQGITFTDSNPGESDEQSKLYPETERKGHERARQNLERQRQKALL